MERENAATCKSLEWESGNSQMSLDVDEEPVGSSPLRDISDKLSAEQHRAREVSHGHTSARRSSACSRSSPVPPSRAARLRGQAARHTTTCTALSSKPSFRFLTLHPEDQGKAFLLSEHFKLPSHKPPSFAAGDPSVTAACCAPSLAGEQQREQEALLRLTTACQRQYS